MVFLDRLALICAARETLRERHLLIEAAAGYGKRVFLRQLQAHVPGSAYLSLTAQD